MTTKKAPTNQTPLVSLQVVVLNGEKYLRQCLRSLANQTYTNLEVLIWDNNSTDSTRSITKKEFPQFRLVESPHNLGTWGGQEAALSLTRGQYIVAVSVDIILEPDFVSRAVEVMEREPSIGALEPKIYQYQLADLEAGRPLPRKVIDTCGFQIYRSRRVTNIGHGEEDRGQYQQEREIFAVEGATPILRRSALEDIRIDGHFADPKFFWYVDDLDFAWRLNLFGWKQIYSPTVIAHHDRSTTKSLQKSKLDFIRLRRKVPFFKRALDYRNTIFTLIKNEQLANLKHDFHLILMRQLKLWAYFLVFEPRMLLELLKIGGLLKNMLQKRDAIMKKARRPADQMRRWFQVD